MGNPREKLRDFINSTCIKILEWRGFDISKPFLSINIFRHLILACCCIIMFVLSIISIKTVGLFLFFFHFISLFYKWTITLFKKRNCKIEADFNKTVAEIKVSSPYTKQFSRLSMVLLVLALIFVLAICKIPNITFDVLYTIAVYLSIITTLVWDVLDGLVSLYHAKPHINVIEIQ